MKQTSSQYKLISAFLACCLYGSWAYYINYGNHWADGLNSALAQGVSSFFLTLSIVVIVTFLYEVTQLSGWLKVILPSFITVVVVAVFLVMVHWLIGTQYLIVTILPSIIVASIFCMVTAIKLRKLND